MHSQIRTLDIVFQILKIPDCLGRTENIGSSNNNWFLKNINKEFHLFIKTFELKFVLLCFSCMTTKEKYHRRGRVVSIRV